MVYNFGCMYPGIKYVFYCIPTVKYLFFSDQISDIFTCCYFCIENIKNVSKTEKITRWRHMSCVQCSISYIWTNHFQYPILLILDLLTRSSTTLKFLLDCSNIEKQRKCVKQKVLFLELDVEFISGFFLKMLFTYTFISKIKYPPNILTFSRLQRVKKM